MPRVTCFSGLFYNLTLLIKQCYSGIWDRDTNIRNTAAVLLFADHRVVRISENPRRVNKYMEAYNKASVTLYYDDNFFPKLPFLIAFSDFICSFQDFDIQGSRRCSLDWLTIETYKNIESYRACGSTIPPPYISSQDHIWIRFHSDDSISRKGFRLAYFSGVFLIRRKMVNRML